MTPRRDVACAICGLFACAHLAALGTIEAAHPHERDSRPTIGTMALPLEPPHDHQDHVGIARILDIGLVQTTSTGAVPFIKGPLHRRARRARVVSPVLNLGPVNLRSTSS